MQLISLDYYSCAVTVALSVIALLYLYRKTRRSNLPYPPGPKGLPLIGNLRDMPTSLDWEVYAEWSRKYGSDVVHATVAGTHLIIVNSLEASTELFEKRSSIYSDRPHLYMLMDLVGLDWSFPILPYASKWRSCRRLFHSFFNPNVVDQWQPQELRATHALLNRIADTPEEYWDHLRLMTGSMILDFTYGIQAETVHNPFMKLVTKAMEIAAEVTNPGAYLVDTIPVLRHVPEWMPGAGFKTKARKWKKIVQETGDKPFQHVKDQIANGVQKPSIVSLSLEKLNGDAKAEDMLRAVAATIYGAGSDTTVSALYTFVLAMVMHPEVARKAQQDIDQVVGFSRLPDFSDQESLPYISAIIQEILRWKPVAPLGVPHRLMVDDIYNGMFMPAGSIVFGNIWALLQDENLYPEPKKFNPDRFMKGGKLNQNIPMAEAAFGFGRRVCPGLHLALSTLFINIVSILAVFNIEKAVDEQGNTIEISGEFKSDLICHPLPFRCSFKPRSQQALNLILESHANHQ